MHVPGLHASGDGPADRPDRGGSAWLVCLVFRTLQAYEAFDEARTWAGERRERIEELREFEHYMACEQNAQGRKAQQVPTSVQHSLSSLSVDRITGANMLRQHAGATSPPAACIAKRLAEFRCGLLRLLQGAQQLRRWLDQVDGAGAAWQPPPDPAFEPDAAEQVLAVPQTPTAAEARSCMCR